MKIFKSALFILSFIGFSVMAGQVVIVNPANAAAIDKQAISRIFLGKLKTFPGGGKVEAVNQKSGSPAKNEFDQKLLGKSGSQIKAYWSKLMFSGKGKPPQEVDSDAAIKALVAGDANAISYIDETNVDGTVKVILKF